jgi:hypothetical protein
MRQQPFGQRKGQQRRHDGVAQGLCQQLQNQPATARAGQPPDGDLAAPVH